MPPCPARVTRLLVAVLLGASAVHAADDEDDSDGPARFHDVKAWRGTLVATARANPDSVALHDRMWRDGGRGARWNFEFSASVSVEFLLDEYESEPSVWRGRVTGSGGDAGFRYFVHVPDSYKNNQTWNKAFTESEWKFQGSGPLDFSGDPKVELQFHRRRGWSVRLASGRLPIRVETMLYRYQPPVAEQDPAHDYVIGPSFTKRESSAASALGMGGTGTFPYPKTGLVLDGRERRAGTFPTIGGGGFHPDVIWEYSVNLVPAKMEELKLEIEEPAGYKTWRPQTTAQRGAGPALEVTARVVTASGSPPKVAVERFEWELLATSREPGVALNFPVDAADSRADLELDAEGGLFQRDEEGQKIVRVVREGHSDRVKVMPYDWGGWSTLQVTAFLADGRRLVGKVRNASEPSLRLPKRTADSHIADAWKEAKRTRAADDADDENSPVGSGVKGDGLTLYEEYRGFYEAGDHREGDPVRKDFFVDLNDAWGALPGVVKFQGLTGLAVHFLCTKEEFPLSRVINANHARGAHRVAQHGVRVRIKKGLVGQADTVGGPANPGKVSSIDLMQDFAQFDPARAAKIAAHELCHSVNVYHHGDAHEKVGWVAQDGKLFEVSLDAPQGVEISVFREKPLQEITAGIIDQLRQVPNNAVVDYLGRDQGQHSGAECCVMRYHLAKSYIGRGQPGVRIAEYKEPIGGTCLCSAAAGTGVNAPDHFPQSRYGAAAAGRGNCLHQIHVNDAVEAPGRGLPSPASAP